MRHEPRPRKLRGGKTFSKIPWTGGMNWPRAAYNRVGYAARRLLELGSVSKVPGARRKMPQNHTFETERNTSRLARFLALAGRSISVLGLMWMPSALERPEPRIVASPIGRSGGPSEVASQGFRLEVATDRALRQANGEAGPSKNRPACGIAERPVRHGRRTTGSGNMGLTESV